jgi:hypothetical protein
MALTRRLERKQLADGEEEEEEILDIASAGEAPAPASTSISVASGRVTRSQTGARVAKRVAADAEYDDSQRPRRKRSVRSRPKASKATVSSEEGDDSGTDTEVPTRPTTPVASKGPISASATLLNASVDDIGAPSYDSLQNLDWIPKARRRGRPLPVPVPNLTKKSRGRRVPTSTSMASITSENGETTANEEEEVPVPVVVAPPVVVTPAPVSGTSSSGRFYTCQVQDCGKLFSRGEHLKRHIRSIHTYEKRRLHPF